MTLIESSEWHDYRAILKDYGYREEDFEPIEMADPPSKSELRPTRGSLTIRRKGSLTTKVYRIGLGSTWLADFNGDLARGEFGVRGLVFWHEE
jgi:hypothetical protein